GSTTTGTGRTPRWATGRRPRRPVTRTAPRTQFHTPWPCARLSLRLVQNLGQVTGPLPYNSASRALKRRRGPSATQKAYTDLLAAEVSAMLPLPADLAQRGRPTRYELRAGARILRIVHEAPSLDHAHAL